ncbi:hypothetical protein LCGC14_1554680 [marine sediment metagenome]|uniref:Uncharacterized protein n=1 Tax=marine sediment metagenome TaxID=412755 RepID=A0A0F9LQ26_9ZZZZ
MTNQTVNEITITAQNIFNNASGALEAMSNATTRDECEAAQNAQQAAADYSRTFKAELNSMIENDMSTSEIKTACNEFITKVLKNEGWIL